MDVEQVMEGEHLVQPFGIAFDVANQRLLVADGGLPPGMDGSDKHKVETHVHHYTHTYLVTGVMPYRGDFLKPSK